MITAIHHVALHTARFDRLVTFYREAFGFVPACPEVRWENNAEIDGAIGVPGSAARTVMLRAGSCYLEVFEYASPPAREGQPLRPNDHGYTHFCVDTTDLDADLEKLLAAGYTLGGNRPIGDGGIRAVYGYDPDGNVIEIQQLTRDHDFALARLSEAAPA